MSFRYFWNVKNKFQNTYIYQGYNISKKTYVPVAKLNSADYNNDIERALRTDRLKYIEIDFSFLSIPQGLNEIFFHTSNHILIPKKLNDVIIELDNNYFKNSHYEFLCFIIGNSNKIYLEHLKEDSSVGLENDFKTLDSQRKKFIQILERFIQRYTYADRSTSQLIKAKFFFTDKNIEIDNFLVLDDLLRTYVENYSFHYEDNGTWKERVNEFLSGFDVEDWERDFRIKLAYWLYHYILNNGVVKPQEDKILNESLRIINIIFSLSSIPINNETKYFQKDIPFAEYYSISQINVLRKWISRHNK